MSWRSTAAIAAVVFLACCLVAYGGLLSHSRPGDTDVYAKYGRALVHDHRIPYRDFYDEYPPGSVPVFVLPVLIWDAHYVLVFKLLMAACGLAFLACSAWVLTRLRLSPYRLAPVALAPLLMGPVFLNRYDPLAALLTALALVALLAGRDRTTGGLLGAGAAMKLYPAVPALVAVRRIRDRTGSAVAFVVTGAVLVLPFFALAPGGVGFSLWSQAKRHLQSETLAASALLVADKLHVYSARFVGGSPGSVDLGGRLPDALAVLSTLVSLALVALVLAAYWRGPDTDRRLVTAWAAALVGFTFFGKVLSPQYLTWVIPFVPLAAGRRGLYAAGTLLVAMALTQPYSFLGRIYHYDWTIWVLFVRNVLLVATFAFLYSALRNEPS